jgi:hypothetical protein
MNNNKVWLIAMWYGGLNSPFIYSKCQYERTNTTVPKYDVTVDIAGLLVIRVTHTQFYTKATYSLASVLHVS